MSDWAVQERINLGLDRAERASGKQVSVILINEADVRALSDEEIERIRKRKESNAPRATFGYPFGPPETYEAQIERERLETENFIAGKSLMAFNGVRLLMARVKEPIYLVDVTAKPEPTSPS